MYICIHICIYIYIYISPATVKDCTYCRGLKLQLQYHALPMYLKPISAIICTELSGLVTVLESQVTALRLYLISNTFPATPYLLRQGRLPNS